MRRAITAMVWMGAAGALCWLFPLFHIVPLKRAADGKAPAAFNPARFAEDFWSEKLLKSLDRATPAETLVAAIQADPAAAKKSHARIPGLGDGYSYFLRGEGRILAVSSDEVSVAIADGATADVVLKTDMIFGNTLRDGTGLLSPDEFPDSQVFNDIAAELNNIAETRVLPGLRERAKAGAQISFAGCAEVEDESTDLNPLKVIPIRAEIP